MLVVAAVFTFSSRVAIIAAGALKWFQHSCPLFTLPEHSTGATVLLAFVAVPPGTSSLPITRDTAFESSPMLSEEKEDGGDDDDDFQPVQLLKDISGLAYMGDGTFIGVHDAKLREPLPRVSMFRLPTSLGGIKYMSMKPNWPEDRSSNDLESAARIPGTRQVLLCESGDDASELDRIYLAEVGRRSIHIKEHIRWSSFAKAYNVEASAVALTDSGHLFLWAERNSTTIHWRDLQLSPLAIGARGVSSGSGTFELSRDQRHLCDRPVVGLDVDSDGAIYAACSHDIEGEGDFGPYRRCACNRMS